MTKNALIRRRDVHLSTHTILQSLTPTPASSRSFWSREYFEPIPTDARSAMNQSKFDANTCNALQARENACDQVTISLGFAFHWLRKWLEFCKPITEQSDAKSRQTRNFFRHFIKNRCNLNNKYFSRIFMYDHGVCQYHQYIVCVISPAYPPTPEEIRSMVKDRKAWRSS